MRRTDDAKTKSLQLCQGLLDISIATYLKSFYYVMSSDNSYHLVNILFEFTLISLSNVSNLFQNVHFSIFSPF